MYQNAAAIALRVFWRTSRERYCFSKAALLGRYRTPRCVCILSTLRTTTKRAKCTRRSTLLWCEKLVLVQRLNTSHIIIVRWGCKRSFCFLLEATRQLIRSTNASTLYEHLFKIYCCSSAHQRNISHLTQWTHLLFWIAIFKRRLWFFFGKLIVTDGILRPWTIFSCVPVKFFEKSLRIVNIGVDWLCPFKSILTIRLSVFYHKLVKNCQKPSKVTNNS